MPGNIKYELNEYLFFEFGVDGDEILISDIWPFDLMAIGEIEGESIFEFTTNNEPYYAIYGRSIRCEPKDGADLELLSYQIRGAQWIGSQGPVDLSTSRGEHPSIPLVPERRNCIETLARELGRKGNVKILEGLFLEKRREYLALVEFSGENIVHVVGSSIRILDIPKSKISPWKVLARAIGIHHDTQAA